MANIVFTHKFTSGLEASQSSFVTASASPTANTLQLLAVSSSLSSTPNTPTVTGASMTWVQVATQSINGFVQITLFRAMSASPGSGALTIDFGGQNQDRCNWSLVEASGTRITGSNGVNAIVQSNKASGASVGSISISLGAVSSSANATFGAVTGQDGTAPTITVGSGYTQAGTKTTGFNTLTTEYRTDAVTTVNATYDHTVLHAGIIGIEIANVSTEPTGKPPRYSFIM